MFVADVDRFAALPTGNSVNMMQGISMDFGPSLFERCNESKLTGHYPNFFLRFTNKSLVEAFAILNVPADYIPIAWPRSSRGRTQTEQYPTIGADEHCPYSFGNFVSHCGWPSRDLAQERLVERVPAHRATAVIETPSSDHFRVCAMARLRNPCRRDRCPLSEVVPTRFAPNENFGT